MDTNESISETQDLPYCCYMSVIHALLSAFPVYFFKPLQVSIADGTHLVLFLPREAVTKHTSICTERQKGVVHSSS